MSDLVVESDTAPLIELVNVTKDYRGLRPLRIQHLAVHAAESVALIGLDAPMAEVLVNLITGAQLPDEGEVRVRGRATSSITVVDDWVTELDRFGLVSTRAVLVDRFTTEQNLAMPLSLEIEQLPPPLRVEVAALAAEVGLSSDELAAATSALSPAAQLRLRLGRALALRPQVVLAEHPNAELAGSDASSFARDFLHIISQREIAGLVVTADTGFAASIATRVLQLQPATGQLVEKKTGWRRWLS